MNPPRTSHVHSTIPVIAIDVLSFKSLDQGRKGGFKSDRGEDVVFDDLYVVDSQELMRDCQRFGT